MVPRGWNVLKNLPRLCLPSIATSPRFLSVLSFPLKPSLNRQPPALSTSLRLRSSSTDEFEPLPTEEIESIDAKDYKENVSSETFRSFLYPDETDPLFKQLNQANSVQEVFVFLHRHHDQLSPLLVSQAVMVLWDLQRLFLKFCMEEYLADGLHELKNYIKGVNGHPDFEAMLRSLGEHYMHLGPDQLTCVLLYLGKMGVLMNHPVMQKMVLKCSEEFATYPLTAISRYLVAFQQGNSSLGVTKDVIPFVLQKLKTVEDAEEMRLLTICLSHLSLLNTKTTVDLHMNKTLELLDRGVIGPHTPKTIVKILHFVNFNRNFKANPDHLRRLMICLEGNISQFRIPDIISIHRSLEHNLETAKLLEDVEKFVENCLSEVDPLALPIDLLNCSSLVVAPLVSTTKMEKLIEEHVKSASFSSNIIPIFKLLRNIKTPNRDLCDLYWHTVASVLRKDSKDHSLLLNIAYKYMHFNNNMGGTYRNDHFESTVVEKILDLLQSPFRFVTPTVSRSACFLLAYSKDGLPPKILDQVLNMREQFSVVDCHNLSRGVKVATNLKSGVKNPVVLDQIVKVSSLLNSSIRDFLQSKQITLQQNESMMRIYLNIRGVVGTDLHERLLENYSKFSEKDMSGRVIRDLSNTFLSNRSLVPSIVNIMEDYVIKAGNSLVGNTAERYLNMLYSLGYYSPKLDQSVQVVCDLVMRDNEKMNAFSLLSAAMALSFFQQLPLALIQFIFTVEFLDRVDNELKVCYSRALYPIKVRQLMMELNRSVCLDYPQADVPWFHEKYCQENRSHHSQSTPMHKEIFNTLSHVAGGPDFVKQNSLTSYYHNLDFEVVLDEYERPVNLRNQQDLGNNKFTRVAILVNRDQSFTNGEVQLCGPAILKRRHLEMLGYRRVEISRFVWQAMYMSEESARHQFISAQIWPNRRKTELLDGEDLVIS